MQVSELYCAAKMGFLGRLCVLSLLRSKFHSQNSSFQSITEPSLSPCLYFLPATTRRNLAAAFIHEFMPPCIRV